jgi:CRP-like cAMP-binding protein
MKKPNYQSFYDQVHQWVSLSPEQYEQLLAIFHEQSFHKKEHVVLPGNNNHEIVFVLHGLLRFYYLSEDGTESNKAFIDNGTFAGSLASYILDLPLFYGIQALEDTVLLRARYEDFTSLYKINLIFDRLGRKLAEWFLIRKELRARSLL